MAPKSTQQTVAHPTKDAKNLYNYNYNHKVVVLVAHVNCLGIYFLDKMTIKR